MPDRVKTIEHRVESSLIPSEHHRIQQKDLFFNNSQKPTERKPTALLDFNDVKRSLSAVGVRRPVTEQTTRYRLFKRDLSNISVQVTLTHPTPEKITPR